MQHVVFALFRDRQAADTAVAQLVKDDRDHEPHISVVVHRDVLSGTQLEEQVQHSGEGGESDAAHGVALGAGLGAAVGAVLGVLLAGPFGLLGGGPLVGVLFGAGSGSLYGMLSAGLVGAGLTDHSLKRLADGIASGDVLVTVRAPDKPTEARVEGILRRHGAAVAEKNVL